MAGRYPDVIGPRMAYDRDGSVVVLIDGDNVITELTGAQAKEINDEDAASIHGDRRIAVLFPELRDLVGYFARMSGFAGIGALEASIDTSNGLDGTWTLVDVQFDRRDPDWAKMRPTDPNGFRTAWGIVERRWDETVERARGLDPGPLHESVDGEWSFIETLRHLVFATDAWVRRAILGDPSPWHPLDLPWDEMPDAPGIARDRQVRPSLEEVLELRRDRMGTVRAVIDGLTDESLATPTEPVEGVGWPPPESFPLSECLLIVLNEEWLDRQFAERDLDALRTDATRQAT